MRLRRFLVRLLLYPFVLLVPFVSALPLLTGLPLLQDLEVVPSPSAVGLLVPIEDLPSDSSSIQEAFFWADDEDLPLMEASGLVRRPLTLEYSDDLLQDGGRLQVPTYEEAMSRDLPN